MLLCFGPCGFEHDVFSRCCFSPHLDDVGFGSLAYIFRVENVFAPLPELCHTTSSLKAALNIYFSLCKN